MNTLVQLCLSLLIFAFSGLDVIVGTFPSSEETNAVERFEINFFPSEENLGGALRKEKLHRNNDNNKFTNVTFLKYLNQVQSRQEFVKMLGLPPPMQPKLSARVGTAISPSESTVAVEMKSIICNPIETPVHLQLGKSSDLHYPSCVLLERCGGCCYGSSVLSCQPEAVREIEIKVTKLSSASVDGRMRRQESEAEEVILKEVVHTKCACKCIVKEADCDPRIHTYSENECSCKCSDSITEERCLTQEETHYWDSKECSCFCRETLECSTGFHFDHQKCKCTRTPFGESSFEAIGFNAING